MANPITPTIGRVVLVRGEQWTGDAPALVNMVHSDECISVCVMPFGQSSWPLTSINYAEDHKASGMSHSWHWMDYQLKVAAERDLATGETLTS